LRLCHQLSGLPGCGCNPQDENMRYVARMRDLKGPPWKHDSEVALIRDWFYPQHATQDAYSAPQPDMRKRAISKINLYIFKAGDIPHPMVATAGLSEALLHDDQPDREAYISHSAMASIYAMSFVKFVNGFVDRDVARTATATLEDRSGEDSEEDTAGASTPAVKRGGESSMYAYAAKIGMPEKFVDLRHEIVHGDIPEVWYLRDMTETGLQWLWDKWWVKNARGDPVRALSEIEFREMEAAQGRDGSRTEEEGAAWPPMARRIFK
jgi:Las1-like